MRRRSFTTSMAGQEQSGTRWFVVLVGALAVVAGVVLFVVRASQPGEAAPAEPNTTTVMIVSDPAGATVTAVDGGLLGVTPFEVTLPKTQGEMPVLVRRDGYQERRVTVPLFSATGRIDVMMTAVGEPPPPPPKPLPKDWQP